MRQQEREGNVRHLHVVIPADMLRRLRHMAADRDTSLSQLVRELLIWALEQQEKTTPKRKGN